MQIRYDDTVEIKTQTRYAYGAGASYKVVFNGLVFFGEDFATARYFADAARAGRGASRATVLSYSVPEALAGRLGLTNRYAIGTARGASWIDILGGTGFERVLRGGSLELFNTSVKSGSITVRGIAIP